jgi:hypothetical protein
MKKGAGKRRVTLLISCLVTWGASDTGNVGVDRVMELLEVLELRGATQKKQRRYRNNNDSLEQKSQIEYWTIVSF